MRHLATWIGAAALALALAACAPDDEVSPNPGASSTTTAPPGSTVAPATTFPVTGDDSAFCDAMLGLGRIGGDPTATPDQVLADNQVLVTLLDEAQANTPGDAPPDLDSLIDDYRAASQALVAAGGEVEAAFAALQRDAPDVVARLGSSSSHVEAYDFLVARCGITAP